MRRLRFWTNILIVLVPLGYLLTGAVGLVRHLLVFLTTGKRLSSIASVVASSQLGRDVVVGEVTLKGDLWDANRENELELADIHVFADTNNPQRPTLTIPRLRVHFTRNELMAGEENPNPRIRTLQLTSPSLALVRDAKGNLNVSPLLKEILGKPSTTKKAFVHHISVKQGNLFWNDAKPVAPSGVPSVPLATSLQNFDAVLFLHPDKSITANLTSPNLNGFAQGIEATCIFQPEPLSIEGSIRLSKVQLPALLRRVMPPTAGNVSRGTSDLRLNLSYHPTKGRKGFQPEALQAQGHLEIQGADYAGRIPYDKVQNFGANLDIDATSVRGTLTGNYAGSPITLSGSVANLPWLLPNNRPKPELNIQATGHAPNWDTAYLLKLPLLQQWLRKASPALRTHLASLQGRGELRASWSGNVRQPSAFATLRMPQLSNAKMRLSNVILRTDFDGKRVQNRLTADVSQGKMVVMADIGVGRGAQYQVVARGRGIEVAGLQPLWKPEKGSAVPVSGKADLDADVLGNFGGEMQSDTRLQLEKARIKGEEIRSATAQVQTRGDQVLVRHLRVDDSRGFLVANGTANLKSKQLDLKVAADEIDLGTILALVPQKPAEKGTAPSSETESESLLDIEGVAYLRGGKEPSARLQGTFDKPQFVGRLTAFNVRLGRLESERVETLFDIQKDRILLNQGNILLTPGVVTFSGILSGLDTADKAPPGISLEAQCEDVDLNRLLTLAGVDPRQVRASGTVATDPISLTGTTRDIMTREPFKIYLENTTLNDLPIADAEITIGYKDRTIDLPVIMVKAMQGEINGSGAVQPDGALSLDLTAKGIDIPSALSPFTKNPRLDALKGTLNARAMVRGKTSEPQVSLNVATTGLNYQNYSFGDLQGAVHYRDRQVVAEGITLGELAGGEGRLQIPRLQFDPEKKTVQGSLQWSGVSFTGMRGLLQAIAAGETDPMQEKQQAHPLLSAAKALAPLEGSLAGSANVSGEVSNPQVSLSWDDTPLSIDGYGITLAKGGGTVNRERASFQKLNLQSPDGLIEIQAPEINYAGNLVADLTAVDINLGFLKNWLKPTTTTANASSTPEGGFNAWLKGEGETEVGGKGTFAVQIRGKTSSPEIEQASLNLNRLELAKRTKDGKRDILFGLDRLDLNDITLKEGVIDASSIALRYQDTVLRGTAHLEGFQWASPFFLPEARLKTTARLVPRSDEEQNLQSLTRFAPGLLAKESTGRLLASLATEGTLEDPAKEVSGSISLTAPRLQLNKIATGFTGVEGLFEVAKGSLHVRNFKGTTRIFKETDFARKNVGSAIQFSGSLPLGFSEDAIAEKSDGIRLKIGKFFFEETPLPGADSGSARGQADIDLRLIGSLKEPTIKGSVTFAETLFALPGEFAALSTSEAKPPAYPKFDLSFIAANDVRLRNLLLDTRVEGKLTTTGSPAEPRLDGQLEMIGGKLRLLTTRLNLLKPSLLVMKYPVLVEGQPSFGLDVNLQAEANIARPSSFGGSGRKERTSLRILGPLTGAVTDPVTGESRLRITSNDPSIDSRTLMQTLLFGDTTAFRNLGSTPGNVLAQQLTNVFTGAVLPGVFDRPAEQLGFSELSIGYDPVQNVSLNISRNIFGPLYISYSRSLASSQELFTFRTSLRVRDRFQATYEVRERNEQRVLLEGVWRW